MLHQIRLRDLVQNPKRLRGEPTVGKAKTIHENKMALFHECTLECAQKELDTADIVIALGKLGRGGTGMRR